MSRSFAEITEEALQLPPQEQLQLASALLEQSADAGDVDAEAEWDAEIEQRIRLVDSGLAKGRPFVDVIRDINHQLGQ